MIMAGGFSIHCADLTRGEPAVGLFVELLNPQGRIIASGRIDRKGMPDCSESLAEPKPNGVYTARFHVSDYFRRRGLAASQNMPFLDIVPFQFESHDPGFHVHLPFKFSPWGFSCFRGN